MSLEILIPQMRPEFGVEECKELMAYLEQDVFYTEYKKTQEFESQISEFTGSKHAIVVNNGTVSLTMAALALGVGPGDEVIVPNYTMIATPNSVKLLGASPVFVDVDEKTLIMSLEAVKSSITLKTKAIMLVLANGRAPAEGVDAFKNLSNETGIPIIEDAAQALGSYYKNGLHIGRVGAVGSFSFSTPKIISTGQGGALITDSDDLAIKLRKLKDFGRASGGNDLHDSIGFNFKFTDLQACVGIAQMKKLPQRILRKRQIIRRYYEGFSSCQAVKLFENDLNFTTPWFMECVVQDRENLSKYLAQKGIGTRPMYPPINQQKAYMESGNFPNSSEIGSKGLWLPSFISLSDDQIDFVCNSISEYF